MFEQAKEDVYGYIGWLIRCLPPEQALKAFYALMLDRVTPHNPEIRASLTAVIEDERFKQEDGLHFLNRVFYTICNPLNLDGELWPYLKQLVGWLNSEFLDPPPINPTTRSFRERLQEFSSGEYGNCLRRQMHLDGDSLFSEERRQSTGTLSDYLPDYFCMYRSVTRTPDIVKLEREMYNNPEESGVSAKQAHKLQQTYDAVYQYRALRLQGEQGLVNPTNLNVAAFEYGLRHYSPRRKGSFYAKAQELRGNRDPYMRYESYRPQIRDYLVEATSMLPISMKDELYEGFHRALSRTDDYLPMEDITYKRLFSHLLDAVFLPEYNSSNILRLEHYVNESKPSGFTGMLMSLVLACPMIRFNLEKKLGYLYQVFEEKSTQTVQWLLELFENVNLALVMNAKKIGYLFAD